MRMPLLGVSLHGRSHVQRRENLVSRGGRPIAHPGRVGEPGDLGVLASVGICSLVPLIPKSHQRDSIAPCCIGVACSRVMQQAARSGLTWPGRFWGFSKRGECRWQHERASVTGTWPPDVGSTPPMPRTSQARPHYSAWRTPTIAEPWKLSAVPCDRGGTARPILSHELCF